MHSGKMRGIMRRDMRRELIDEFKRRLESRMRDRGLNRRSLSIAAGLGATAVRDIQEGKSSEPRYSTIRCLAGALQCHMTDLVPDDPKWPTLPQKDSETAFLEEQHIPLRLAEDAITACSEAALRLGVDLSPDRIVFYVSRLCKWAIAQKHVPSLDEMRTAISFAITQTADE